MDDLPVKHGHLFVPPQGKILKRNWHKKYYALYGASKYGVERVEVFDNEDGFVQSSSKKIIALDDCVKVVQAPQKNQQNVFEVITKTQVHQFSTETTQELAEWVLAFQTVAFGGLRRDGLGGQISSLPSLHSVSSVSPNDLLSSSLSPQAEEENQIYSSFGGPEVYFVRVIDTEASMSCGLKGTYRLVVNPHQLFLLEESGGGGGASTVQDFTRYLYAWPYRHIRRYGRSKDAFTFEAGRKCASGDGTFTFATADANAIFLSVQASTRTLKREEEEGIRSTPVSTTTTKVAEEESKEVTRTKVTPPFAKPPRKSKISIVDGPPSSSNEPIRLEISSAARMKMAELSSAANSHSMASLASCLSFGSSAARSPEEPMYAVPEVRMDAWKTFGMATDNIHEEKSLPSDVFYSAVSPTATTSSSQANLILLQAKKESPKILVRTAAIADKNGSCYDHLSQFAATTAKMPSVGEGGSASATSSAVSSPTPCTPDGHIYSRLISSSSTTSSSADLSPSTSKTLLIESPSKEEAKSLSATEEKGDDSIQHFFQNADVYAVVSKPLKKP